MKMKLLSLLLSLTMLLSMFSTMAGAVSAEDASAPVTYSLVTVGEAAVGDTITVDVTVSENHYMVNGQIWVKYDPAALEIQKVWDDVDNPYFEGVNTKIIKSSAMWAFAVPAAGLAKFAFASSSSKGPTAGGTIFTLTFKVLDGFADGTTLDLVVPEMKSCDGVTNGGRDFATNVVEQDATVAATPKTPKGDVNGDGVISMIDAFMVFKYVVEEITLEGAALMAADVVEDGVINIWDVTALFDYLLGYIGEYPQGHPAQAEYSSQIVVGTYEVTQAIKAGESVTIPVSFGVDTPDVHGVEFALCYDSALLSATKNVNIDSGKAIFDDMFSATVKDGYIKFAGLSRGADVAAGDVIAEVTFTALQDITEDSDITIRAVDMPNMDYQAIPVSIVNGGVNIITTTTAVKGDVNGDGVISMIDAFMVFKYVVEEITLEGAALMAADVVEDGVINIWDATALFDFLLGYIGEYPQGHPAQAEYSSQIVVGTYEVTQAIKAGESVTIPISFGVDTPDVHGVEFALCYDSALLSATKNVNTDSGKAIFDDMFSATVKDGYIKFAGLSRGADVAAGDVIAEVTFTALQDITEDVAVTIRAVDMPNMDYQAIPVSVVNGGVNITATTTTAVPVVFSASSVDDVKVGDIITVDVTVSDEHYLVNGDLFIHYDPAALEIQKVSEDEDNPYFDGVNNKIFGSRTMWGFGVTKAGEAKFVFASSGDTGVTTGGTMFTLTFKVLAGIGDSTDVTLSKQVMMSAKGNGDYAPETEFVAGTVTKAPAPVVFSVSSVDDVKVGDIITVDVTVSDEHYLVNGDLFIHYDPAALEIQKVSEDEDNPYFDGVNNKIFGSRTMWGFGVTKAGEAKFVFASSGDTGVTTGGTMFTLTFKVLAGIGDSTNVTLSKQVMMSAKGNGDYEPETEFVAGVVTKAPAPVVFSASSVDDVKVGDIITVDVTVSEEHYLVNGDLLIHYDPAALEIQKVSDEDNPYFDGVNNKIFGSRTMWAFAVPTPGLAKFAFASSGDTGVTTGGTMFTLTFKVLAGIGDSTDVTLSKQVMMSAKGNGDYAPETEFVNGVVNAVPIFIEGDYMYVINADGVSCTITGYTGSAAEIAIPETLGGYAVTAIDAYAFLNCDVLRNVEIPASVSDISSSAFDGCPNLTLWVYADSAALQYAKDNGIPYVIADMLQLKGDCFYKGNEQIKGYQLVAYKGDFYFVGDFSKITRNKTVYLSEEFVSGFTFADGTPIPAGNYEFGADGKMIVKNGVIGDYVFKNGVRLNAYQLVEVDGDFYFVSDGNKIARNKTLYLNSDFVSGFTFADGTPIPAGNYEFGADGKMVIKDGVVGDFIYKSGVRLNAYQLVKVDGDFYFISDGNKIVRSKAVTLGEQFVSGFTFADGTPIPAGKYEFDADGKMVIKDGLVGDSIFENNVCVKAYRLYELDGALYFISDGNKIVRNTSVYLTEQFVSGFTFADGTPIPAGKYAFDADGKMITQDGLVGDFIFENNVCVKAYRLYELDGALYFISDGNKIVRNTSVYLSEQFVSGFTFADGTPLPAGKYTFDADGKMTTKNGLIGDFIYKNNECVKAYRLYELDGALYFISDANKIVRDKTVYLGEQFVSGFTFADGTPLPAGKYTFDADGKMTTKNGLIGDFIYKNNECMKAYQLYELDGALYFISDGNKITRSKTVYLGEQFVSGFTFADGTPLPAGKYEFDADGKMVIKNGVVGDYVYKNNVYLKAYQLVKVDGDFYFIGDANKITRNKRVYLGEQFVRWQAFEDGTPLIVGYYEFDADGKLIRE